MNLSNYQKELINYIKDKYKEDGIISTQIPSLKFYTTTSLSEFTSVIYEPSLCIVLQGEKAVGFADEMFSYSETKYLLACTHIPANVKIQRASNEVPYVAVMLRFSLEQIYEVLKEINNTGISEKKALVKGLCFDDLDESLLEPVSRLIKLLDKPTNDIKFLSSLIMKEIIYTLLERNGDFLKQHVLEGTLTNQIVKAITEIKNNFSQTINMKDLARTIGISESSLYHNFKKITSMSPLQFQKKIRLEEAKQMLITQNIEATQVAFAIGYESPSQFSREYTRMFGMSPIAHTNSIKNKDIA
jgi:AraC-like DNA-binding protein